MSYFYPFGIPQVGVSASFATLAISASAASTNAITGYTASYAAVTQSSGETGPPGGAPTCAAGPQGPVGPIGPSGSRGPALTSCPENTKQCTNITPPAGYIVVCIEVPPGCTLANTYCPGETPPSPCYGPFTLYNVGDQIDECNTDQGSGTYYSNGNSTVIENNLVGEADGYILYTNSGCSSVAANVTVHAQQGVILATDGSGVITTRGCAS